jgi:hypothetical protein
VAHGPSLKNGSSSAEVTMGMSELPFAKVRGASPEDRNFTSSTASSLCSLLSATPHPAEARGCAALPEGPTRSGVVLHWSSVRVESSRMVAMTSGSCRRNAVEPDAKPCTISG